jgi:hypothetical protein
MQTAYIVYGKIIDESTIKLNEPIPFDNQDIKIIVELEQKNQKSRKDLYGKYENKISMSSDFDEPLDDFKEYMK